MDQRSPKRAKNEKGESSADEETAKSKQASDERRWEDLPINLLVDIFQKLSLYDLTLGVPFVCKSWYEASLDPSCWKILDFGTINPWPGSAFTEKFKREYRLDEYQLRECPKLDIYNPPLSGRNPGLMRKFILTLHETLLRRVTNW